MLQILEFVGRMWLFVFLTFFFLDKCFNSFLIAVYYEETWIFFFGGRVWFYI